MIDKKYKNYLSGKRVALVGPAEYLTKLNTGKYIDSFDVVVRVNMVTEIIDNYFNSKRSNMCNFMNCSMEFLFNDGSLEIGTCTRCCVLSNH